MPLSDLACKNAKPSAKTRKLSAGGSLQLWVKPSGSKLWVLAYRYLGKWKTISFGPYPRVSLVEARAARDKAKSDLANGRDPMDVRRASKSIGSPTVNSFRAIAEEYVDLQGRKGRAPATMEKLGWLLEFSYPDLGDKDVAKIRPVEVLAVLRKVEIRKRYHSAIRLRSTLGAVFRLAVATERAETDPTSALLGALVQPRVRPRPAITEPKAFGGLLRAIDGFEGQPTTVAALKLMAILFPRPGELRGAEWPEFNFDIAIWTIPGPRTKMRRPHQVPLPRQALAILADLREVNGAENLVFPGLRTNRIPISENTLNAALRRMGYSQHEATSHGFRASASTMLNESGLWHPDAIERQLAHIETNGVRRAYDRATHWTERVRMMQWWADYIDNLRAGTKFEPAQENDIEPARQLLLPSRAA